MSAAARFEIVRVDGGWFVRFWAANNRIVWITPGLYSRRETAVRAIASLARTMNAVPTSTGVRTLCRHYDVTPVEVSDVDERGTR